MEHLILFCGWRALKLKEIRKESQYTKKRRAMKCEKSHAAKRQRRRLVDGEQPTCPKSMIISELTVYNARYHWRYARDKCRAITVYALNFGLCRQHTTGTPTNLSPSHQPKKKYLIFIMSYFTSLLSHRFAYTAFVNLFMIISGFSMSKAKDEKALNFAAIIKSELHFFDIFRSFLICVTLYLYSVGKCARLAPSHKRIRNSFSQIVFDCCWGILYSLCCRLSPVCSS